MTVHDMQAADGRADSGASEIEFCFNVLRPFNLLRTEVLNFKMHLKLS